MRGGAHRLAHVGVLEHEAHADQSIEVWGLNQVVAVAGHRVEARLVGKDERRVALRQHSLTPDPQRADRAYLNWNEHRVAILGCGWMGAPCVEAYSRYHDTEIVGIVESNPQRRRDIAERFGAKAAYPDMEALLRDTVPDVVSVVTPTKYFKDVVVASAEAGVKGISVEKPLGGVLSDVDEMVSVCESRGVALAGGRVQRAMREVRGAGPSPDGGPSGTGPAVERGEPRK